MPASKMVSVYLKASYRESRCTSGRIFNRGQYIILNSHLATSPVPLSHCPTRFFATQIPCKKIIPLSESHLSHLSHCPTCFFATQIPYKKIIPLSESLLSHLFLHSALRSMLCMVVAELRLSRIRPSTLIVLKNRQSCNNNLKKKSFFKILSTRLRSSFDATGRRQRLWPGRPGQDQKLCRPFDYAQGRLRKTRTMRKDKKSLATDYTGFTDLKSKYKRFLTGCTG